MYFFIDSPDRNLTYKKESYTIMELNQEAVNAIIKERIPLKISIIGVGNAGNQLLNEAVKRDNVQVFAINSSEKDLDNAVTAKAIPSFIIGREGKGAGKDRANGVELFMQNGEDLATKVPAFAEVCSKSDIIIVAGSTAGGTGSGVAPQLIQLLQAMYRNKIIMYVGILPRMTDAPLAQRNAVECIQEVQKCNVPYMLADLEYYKGIPNHEAYQQIQTYLMNMIDIMGGKGLNRSMYGMIDENDMRVILSEPGYLSMYDLNGVTQTQLDKSSLQAMMVELIKHSPAAERTRNGVIRQMGVILNVPGEMDDASMSSDYTELTNYIGTPLSIFENFANVPTATGQMIIILSGQSTPIGRIQTMSEKAKLVGNEIDYDLSQLTNGFAAKHSSGVDLSGESKENDTAAQQAAAQSFFNRNKKA